MSNEGKIEIIPVDAEIQITVGGGAYAILTQLLYDAAAQQTPEEFSKLLQRLKEGGKPQNKNEYVIQFYLALSYEIEVQASKQGKTKFVDPSEIKTS